MPQVKTDILLNGMRLEIHPSKLTKCGEIHINDDCTSAFLFCAFCSSVDGEDLKFFKTLQEFVDHIRWHRSDDFHYSDPSLSPGDPRKLPFELGEEDSRSSLSAAPRHEATSDDITDWIAPPEELFEMNTISNFIEIESAEAMEGKDDEMLVKNNEIVVNTMETAMECEVEDPEITGEVLIELLDLLKKCPCAWHRKTAAKTSPDVIEGVYGLLTAHYNNCAKQTKTQEYVRGILTQVKDCFLEEHKDVDSMDRLPWYFPHLSFLLHRDSQELDKSVFTDLLCPMCGQDSASQADLWEHLRQQHIQAASGAAAENGPITADNNNSPNEKNVLFSHYPKEILEKFIEIYRSQPRLWDKSNDEYFSRQLRRQSYDMLLKILRQHNPSASRVEVLTKINHLRTQFAYDRQKVLSAKNNSKVAPSWVYEQMKFLVDNISKKPRHKPPPPLKASPSNFKKKVKNAKCPICSATFADNVAWLSHMQSAHTTREYQSEDGFFYCTVCGWQNKTKELLMRHLRNRHTHNLQRCSDCNLGFRLLSMLAEHRAKVHNDYLPFRCETCDEGFATRSHLRKHSEIHWCAEDLPHQCEHCGAKFSDRSTYGAHLRRHKAEMKFSCEICQKAFTSKADLRQHTRMHLGDCPDICDSCGKAFRSAQLLTDHLNEVHGGVTFPCGKCEKEFKSEKLLADHYEGHEVQHHCDVCGAVFLRKTSLRKHQRLKHDYVAYDHIKYDYYDLL